MSRACRRRRRGTEARENRSARRIAFLPKTSLMVWCFRLRALAACERRMGLAKTSWEEKERERAMGYVQQDRDKQRLALHAAEHRLQQRTRRGKPAAACQAPAPSRQAPGDGDYDDYAADGHVLHGTLVPHGIMEGDDGAWQDESFDDGGASGEALSRIAQVAAAINRTSFEVGECLRAGERWCLVASWPPAFLCACGLKRTDEFA